MEIPKLVHSAPAGERIAVIFDGEKRRAAYQTYKKVRDRVHLAIFDDSFHERFHQVRQYVPTRTPVPSPL